MTELEDKMDGVKNYSVSVKKKGDEITFLRKIVRGGSDRSYGIEVAALAGVPKPVITAAKRILKHLESTMPKRGEPLFEQLALDMETDDFSDADYTLSETEPETEPSAAQSPDPVTEKIMNELRNMDVPSMTMIEAAQKLFELAAAAKEQ